MYLVILANFSYEPLQDFLAFSTWKVLQFQGLNAHLDGYTIKLFIGLQLQRIDISWDSTGWKSMYALTALVLATPYRRMTEKLKFLLLGIPIIFLLNLLRIITTIQFALTYGFQYFEVLHMFLWREGLILAVIAVWFLWFRVKYNIDKK